MSEVTCASIRESMVAELRGRLDEEERALLRTHLEGCAACRAAFEAERALDEVVARELPSERAPERLRERIAKLRKERLAPPAPSVALDDETGRAAEEVKPPPSVEPRSARKPSRGGSIARRATIVAGLAAAAAVLVYAGYRIPRPGAHGEDPLIAEAVNDHLRVLYASAPLEVKSGGVHQVKPWFAGKLDFAPVLQFGGDDDFPLEGGAVGVFLDRKAAVFAFRRRLHAIDLFVFRADGLTWPAATGPTLGGSPSTRATARGFHVLLWRSGELGYALVSDVDETDLALLAGKIAGD